MRLLLIEDERTLCDAVARRLRRLGYSVDLAYDGERALQLLEVERYDLVLLDLNLPKLDGMSVLRTLRQTDRETRVLILSARSGTADKVDGLDAGANDYLSKPFALAELEARIRSLTQRQFIQPDVCLSFGTLRFDTRSRIAAVNGQTVSLTKKESGILEYLLLNQGRPVSQEELIDHVWDNSVDGFTLSASTSPRCGKSCALRWAMILFITASEKGICWEGRKNEGAVSSMAHYADDRPAYRRYLRFHESAALLIRRILYGLHCGFASGLRPHCR